MTATSKGKQGEKKVPREDTRKAGDYAENIEHVEATRPEPWPGIRGRSKDQESDLPTGTSHDEQADVTRAQRKLEEESESSEPTRE